MKLSTLLFLGLCCVGSAAAENSIKQIVCYKGPSFHECTITFKDAISGRDHFNVVHADGSTIQRTAFGKAFSWGTPEPKEVVEIQYNGKSYKHIIHNAKLPTTKVFKH